MTGKTSRYYSFTVYLALAAITLTVYWPVRHFEFNAYDDQQYVTENPHVLTGLTEQNIVWAFTKSHASNWHPLTWLSHMLDCQLFGPAAGRHHLVNVFFHLLNTLLLLWVLRLMTGSLWRSAFVAALFALHPLRVESVAWVAERKDLLSALLAIFTLAAYYFYVKSSSRAWYITALLFFALGLMAKPMLVTLPFVLLLLDYWPYDRFSFTPNSALADPPNNSSAQLHLRKQSPSFLLREKIPFFVLSALSCLITWHAQHTSGAVTSFHTFSLYSRLANALVSYLKYLEKIFWPQRLALLYPHLGDSLPLWYAAASALLLVMISLAVFSRARSCKYLLVGWLWFLGMLVPVIGLVQVGMQALADRYTYLPATGIFIIVAWGAADLLGRWPFRKIVLAAAAVIVLTALTLVTRAQVPYWRDNLALFSRSLQVTENNYLMHVNYGKTLEDMGRTNEAIYQYNLALKIEPDCFLAHLNLANALTTKGNFSEAIYHHQQALRIHPDDPTVLYNLAVTYQQQGNHDEAIKYYQRSISIHSIPQAYNNLALAYQDKQMFQEAIDNFNRALRLNPRYPDAYNNLANVLLLLGDYDGAIRNYQKSLVIDPSNTGTQENLRQALELQAKSAPGLHH